MDEVIPPDVLRFGQENHRKPEPGASRGAGVCMLSVGSRCPRRKFSRRGSARRGTPPTPPHKAAGIRFPGGDGLRPAGAREWKHPPPVRHTISRSAKGSRSAGHLIHHEAVPLPLEGKALTPAKVGETFPAEQGGNASLAAILENSPINVIWSLVSGLCRAAAFFSYETLIPASPPSSRFML